MGKFEVTQIEKRQRSLFGKLVAVLFFGFHIVMLALLVLTWIGSAGVASNAHDESSMITAWAFGAVGIAVLFQVWMVGTIVLGILMLFTRGRKVILTREEQ